MDLRGGQDRHRDRRAAGRRLEAKPCVQTFTFGQHNHHDLGNNHRPLLRLRWRNAPLYPDAIRVPSWRQENGDKRADPRGRVPGDVFDFTRVTGNSKQRRTWHPTQLNEGLVERCLKLTTPTGGTVLDPFGGTGTTLRVCKRIESALHADRTGPGVLPEDRRGKRPFAGQLPPSRRVARGLTMLVVRIELWPGGCEARKRTLATGTITNLGTGSKTRGNYFADLRDAAGRAWRHGTVTNFPRKRLLAWDLLYRVCKSARRPRFTLTFCRVADVDRWRRDPTILHKGSRP